VQNPLSKQELYQYLVQCRVHCFVFQEHVYEVLLQFQQEYSCEMLTSVSAEIYMRSVTPFSTEI